jgi:mannose-1-phosphate guanylyltransferase
MDHAWAIVLAGGSGTRFWPLSRRARPKQFLPLAGSSSLLARTLERMAPLIPPERVIVVTSAALLGASRAELPAVPAENFLGEPSARNTAAAVGWAAATVHRRDPDARLVVLAADQHITDPDGYLAVCGRALEACDAGTLVTVGITPTRPETGYGWLELGAERGRGVFEVARFVEKPDRARAEAFLAGGRHLWNGGQFFFRADAILDAIRQHLPVLGAALASDAQLADRWNALPSISIDHGVMERAAGVLTVPGAFGWSDVGSWTSAWELGDHDELGNVSEGSDAVLVDCRGTYVHGRPGKTIAVIGLDDLVIVDTEDALLVMPRDRAQDVRAITAELERRGLGSRL